MRDNSIFYIFDDERIIIEFFHEVAFYELYEVKFSEVENVSFDYYGRGTIKRVAKLADIPVKQRIIHFFGIYRKRFLLGYFMPLHEFSPKSDHAFSPLKFAFKNSICSILPQIKKLSIVLAAVDNFFVN